MGGKNVTDEADLGQKAQLINRLHKEHEADKDQLRSRLEKYRARAEQIGNELIAVKEALRRGQWLSWLKDNCPDISERTAQEYMRLARGEVKDLNKRSIDSESAVAADSLFEPETGEQSDEPEDEPPTTPAVKVKKAKRKKAKVVAEPEPGPELEYAPSPEVEVPGWVDPATRIDEAVEMFVAGKPLKKIAKKLKLVDVAELSQYEVFTDKVNEIAPGTFSVRNYYQAGCGVTPSAMERISRAKQDILVSLGPMYTLVESDRQELLDLAHNIIERIEHYGQDQS